jgi:CDP-paratose synthetase
MYSRLECMNILLTGASGYIGYNFTKYLVDKGFDVHVLLREGSNFRNLVNFDNTFLHFYNGEFASILDVFNEIEIDFVFHLATHYDKSDDLITLSKLNEVCVRLTTQLFDAIKIQNKQIGLINVGTMWQAENKFRNAYTMYKSFQEDISFYYASHYKLKVLSLLITDTYGPNDWRPKVINHLKHSILNKTNVRIVNPNAEIDLVYIDDVCEALYQSINHLQINKVGFYKFKIQANKKISLIELIHLSEFVTNTKLIVEYGQSELPYKIENNRILERLPSWEPNISIELGLALCFDKGDVKR